MTALHQQWIDAYDRVKDLPDDELVRTIYKTKIRNTLMKARQRRNQDRVRVILVARRGKSIKALTRRDRRIAEALHKRVQEQGYPPTTRWTTPTRWRSSASSFARSACRKRVKRPTSRDPTRRPPPPQQG